MCKKILVAASKCDLTKSAVQITGGWISIRFSLLKNNIILISTRPPWHMCDLKTTGKVLDSIWGRLNIILLKLRSGGSGPTVTACEEAGVWTSATMDLIVQSACPPGRSQTGSLFISSRTLRFIQGEHSARSTQEESAFVIQFEWLILLLFLLNLFII